LDDYQDPDPFFGLNGFNSAQEEYLNLSDFTDQFPSLSGGNKFGTFRQDQTIIPAHPNFDEPATTLLQNSTEYFGFDMAPSPDQWARCFGSLFDFDCHSFGNGMHFNC
jgi:hypothetical protein